MSSDSTELSFVRCPACSSLVPAISSRCRMCGSTLNASSTAVPPEGSSDQDARKSGRVRQRTVSDTPPEVSSAIDSIRASEEVSSVAEITNQSTPNESEDGADVSEEDPLSAYIEEVTLAEEPANGNGDHTSTEEASAPTSTTMETPPMREEVEVAPPTAVPVIPVQPEPRIEKTQERKVLVESGNRRPGQGSSLSFGRAREGEQNSQNRNNESRSDNNRHQQAKSQGRHERNEEKGRQDHSQHRRDERQREERRDDRRNDRQNNSQRDDRQMRRDESRREEQRQPRRDEFKPRVEEKQEIQHAQAVRTERVNVQPPVVTTGMQGRLFGWLVNYNDPTGTSIELREGKFFISGKTVKDTDLVIEDKSISSPHALVVISTESGLTIQDLMSERGIFVRRSGGEPYKREEETVTLHHGDWVRLGDIEYLISLINHGQ